MLLFVQNLRQLSIYEVSQMIGSLYQGTLTYWTEEITRCDLTTITGIGMCVPFIDMAAFIDRELYVTVIGAGVDKTQDEATIIGTILTIRQ